MAAMPLLHELLTELGIEHEYEIVPDVAHNSQLYYRKLGTRQFEFHQKSLAALGLAIRESAEKHREDDPKP